MSWGNYIPGSLIHELPGNLIIGSTAAREHIPDFRKPKDLDVFGGSPLWDANAETFWHDSFTGWIPPGTHRTATLDELYTIKASHAYWELRNGSWQKHMTDLLTFKEHGAQLIPDLHALLYTVWEERYGKKKVNLDQDADDFFSDAVKRVYEHDSIHDSVAYHDRPMWESFLVPGESVKMDMAAIRAASFEDQVKLFREEVYATALERWIIRNNYRYSPSAAYAKALRKTITSLTKGWSATFLVTNYDVFRQPDIDYVARHHEKSDRLIPIGGC
ncbi:DUF7275 domain-containing protein [Actinoplanes sp. CA-054009]